jgi:DNA-binding NarL/FixJ family response regulator
MTRLLIVGCEQFTFETMRFAMSRTAGATLFGVVRTDDDIRAAIEESNADVIVVDGLRDVSGAFGVLGEIRDAAPDAVVLVLVRERDEAQTAAALEHGAVVYAWSGGVPPRAADGLAGLTSAMSMDENDAAHGRQAHSPLTSRELEALRWVAQGRTNAWIARKLWVTEQTVKFHLSNIYRKLGVSNRTEASHYALVHDLFADEAPNGGRPGRFDVLAPGQR